MKTKAVKRLEAVQRLESGVVREEDLRHPAGAAHRETFADAIHRRVAEAARLREQFGLPTRS